MDNTYQIGDLAPLEATFTNAAGTPTNPTAVTLTVRAPDGTVTTPTPTNTGAGVYHYDQAANQSGIWWYTFKGTGTVAAADRKSFYVENDWITTAGPLSTRALVRLEDAREYVLNNVLDDSQDHKLVRRINAFSEAVWAYTEREWATTDAATRKFTYSGGNFIDLRPYDLRSATSVVAFTDYPTSSQVTLVAGDTVTQGDYYLRPYGTDPLTSTYRWLSFDVALWTSRYWPGSFQVSVTGNWGVSAVPDDVKEAVLIAVDNATKNPEAGAARQFGDFSFAEQVESGQGEAWRALPGESRALLTPYRDSVGLIAA